MTPAENIPRTPQDPEQLHEENIANAIPKPELVIASENMGDVVGNIASAASQVFMKMLEDDPRVPQVPERTEFLTNVAMEAMGKMLGEESLEVTDIREFARQIDPTIPSKKEEDELRTKARTDEATGLLNKHAFYAEAESRQVVGLIMIDGTNFGATNKSKGLTHIDGDEAIQLLSSLLTSNAREGDIIGRIGGDEFAVALVAPGYQHDHEENRRRPKQQITSEEIQQTLEIKRFDIEDRFEQLMREPKNSKFSDMQYPAVINEKGEVTAYTTLSLGVDISPVILNQYETVQAAMGRASEAMQDIKSASHAKLGHAPKVPGI